MKFDPAAEWDKLSPEQQRTIGMAGLLLQVTMEAEDLLDEEIGKLNFGTPQRAALIEVNRRWEAAEQRAWTLLREAVPQDADLYDEGPSIA